MDTPISCVLCPLSFYNSSYNEYQCRGKDYYRTIEDYKAQGKEICGKDVRPNWCPLPLLPEQKNLYKIMQEHTGIEQTTQIMYAQGFNDCLKQIVKGTE